MSFLTFTKHSFNGWRISYNKASFDIEDMTKAERLKLIQLAMPYVLTKPQKEEVEQQQNITVEIIDRLSDYSDKQLDNAIKNQ